MGAFRIVVVSRRPNNRNRWAQALEAKNVVVEIVRSAADPIDREAIALVILDCPGDIDDAIDRCRYARTTFGTTPMLVLAKDRGTRARASLFEAGADGVVIDPFASRELVASVRATLRVASGPVKTPDEANAPREAKTPSEPKAGDEGASASSLAGALALTETEHLLLECLGSRPMVTRSQILERVFPGRHYRADSSHLRVHLHRLRTKLRTAKLTVKTVYGRGYCLLPLDVAARPRLPSTESAA